MDTGPHREAIARAMLVSTTMSGSDDHQKLLRSTAYPHAEFDQPIQKHPKSNPMLKTSSSLPTSRRQDEQRHISDIATKQLSKSLLIHIPGISAFPQMPRTVLRSPNQLAIPAYNVGYDIRYPPSNVRVAIEARPLNGSASHTYSMVSEDNLPSILFQIQPYVSPLHGVPVPVLRNDTTGQLEKGRWGQPLRFFSFLPRWIDIEISGLLLEFWHRLDPRLHPTDIRDRMNIQPGGTMPSNLTLRLRRKWLLHSLGTPSWELGDILPLESELLIVGNLTREQVLLNTSMVMDLEGNRLLKPFRPVDRATQCMESGLSIDHFLQGFDDAEKIPIPANQHVLQLKLHQRLQNLAKLLGYPSHPFNYVLLPHHFQPLWWNVPRGVVPSRQIDHIDSLTHEQFVYHCAKMVSSGQIDQLLGET